MTTATNRAQQADSSSPARATRAGAWLIAGASVALSLVQQCAVTDEVFFSGDAGLKALMARQWTRGDVGPQLNLQAAPWVEQLWNDGLYPFAPPFVFARSGEHLLAFPLAFIALSSPLYAWLGWRGLYVLPLLSLWLAWWAFWKLTDRLALSGAARMLSLAGLGLASFLTPYGSMVWEHAPAVALCVLGAVIALRPDESEPVYARDIAAGVLWGAALWLRLESVCFVAAGLLALRWLGVAPRRWLAMVSGVAIAGISLLVLNLALYGRPLGLHGEQTWDTSEAAIWSMSPGVLLAMMGGELLMRTPVMWLVLLSLALGLLTVRMRPNRRELVIGGWAVVTCVVTASVVPNDGGMQLGPRYLLPALPLIWLWVGLVWDRLALPHVLSRVARAALLVAVLLGVLSNSLGSTGLLRMNYASRVLPLLQSLRERGDRLVVVTHQYMVHDLESLMDERAFVWVHDDSQLLHACELAAEHGIRSFPVLAFSGDKSWLKPRIASSACALELTALGPRGQYALFEARNSARALTASAQPTR